jgi:NADPH-dependent 2,4-dienoyl-CoA reductase/sulfur reductase-like enzyme
MAQSDSAPSEPAINSERHVDALIVGGGPGGMSAAIAAAQTWPEKRILVVRREETPIVPCGIPYIFGTLQDVDKDLLSTAPFTRLGGEILCERVVRVDRHARTALTAEGTQIRWERLILATGTRPYTPPISGAHRPGVFTIHKDHGYLEELFDEVLPDSQRLVVVGGGFIGVEFADEARKLGDMQVSIVEKLPHVLMRNFDAEVCTRVEATLQEHGIEVITGTGVVAFEGEGPDGPVQSILLEDGRRLPADRVLVAIGDRRNTELAEPMDLTMARGGGVWVDAFQRSREDSAVFAVGDCAFKQDFFMRRSIPSLLASTAAAEGRIAGMNLFGLRQERYNTGSIAIYASQLDDLAFGCAGLTAHAAEHEGMPVIIGNATVPDHHPPTMPGTQMMDCRLIFTERGTLLGGQVVGGPTTAEVLNAIGIAIQAKLSASDLVSFQFGSHPRLTAPAHPIVLCAADAVQQMQTAG